MKHESCLFHLLTLLTPVVKHLPLANGGKKGVGNHRNKLGRLFLQITDSQPANVDASVKSLLSLSLLTRKPEKHIITRHKQIYMHTARWGKTTAYLRQSLFTWKPEGAVKAHKLGYFACTWEPAKHFSLLSIILIAQHDSSALNLPIPPPRPPARWLFFFFFF